MSFPIYLRQEFPESLSSRYWSHNPEGEHAMKHWGDVGEIQEIRRNRGLDDIANLEKIMTCGGLTTIRSFSGGDSSVGEAIGFAAVESLDEKKGAKRVVDLWVSEDHRAQGLGGWALGKVLLNVPYAYFGICVGQNIGTSLEWGQDTYKLPGTLFNVYGMAHGSKIDKKVLDGFYDQVLPGFNGIIVAKRKGHAQAEQYVDGEVAAQFRRKKHGFVICDSPDKKCYESVTIAAIHALNP